MFAIQRWTMCDLKFMSICKLYLVIHVLAAFRLCGVCPYNHMNTYPCIIHVYLLFTVSLFTMLSHNQQYIVDPGAQLTLKCEFFKEKFSLFNNPVQWKKFQYGEESEINILGNIKEPFDSTGRFQVSYEPSAPRYTMALTISGKCNYILHSLSLVSIIYVTLTVSGKYNICDTHIQW